MNSSSGKRPLSENEKPDGKKGTPVMNHSAAGKEKTGKI
jgi:hypothetical protein